MLWEPSFCGNSTLAYSANIVSKKQSPKTIGHRALVKRGGSGRNLAMGEGKAQDEGLCSSYLDGLVKSLNTVIKGPLFSLVSSLTTLSLFACCLFFDFCKVISLPQSTCSPS